MIKAILTKPLDGQAEGAEREFDKVDFDRLEKLGAVRRAFVAAPEPPEVQTFAEDEGGKAAPEPLNKMAAPVENKAERLARRKAEG